MTTKHNASAPRLAALLLPLAALLLAACSPAAAAAQRRLLAAAAPAIEGCSDCSPQGYSEPQFRACLRAIQGLPPNSTSVIFPDDGPAAEAARRTFNSRMLREPAATFYARSAADVAAAVACAQRFGVKVSPAGGRQGLLGGAVQHGYLTIDVSALTKIDFSADNKTVTFGAGVNSAMLQAALHDSGISWGGLPAGVCAFVGTSGYLLGGGFGLLGRYAGLACDSLARLQLVLANGSTVEAAPGGPYEDLFWASCGGGGGTFGVATEFTLQLTELPGGASELTAVEITYAPGPESVASAWLALQRALPQLDRRFGFLFWWEQGQLRLEGAFFGALEEAQALLSDAGLLEGLDSNRTYSPAQSDVTAQFPGGLRLQQKRSYYELYQENVVFWSQGASGLDTPWASGQYNASDPQHQEFLGKLMRGQDGHQVVGGSNYSLWVTTQSRIVDALPNSAVQKLAAWVGELQASGLLIYLSGHVLGGAYGDRSPNDTAFPWRNASFILDATVSLPTALVPLLTNASLEQALAAPEEFLSILYRHLDNPHRLYANYQVPWAQYWQRGFWGDNYERLQRIKAAADPLGLFDKPLTVQGAALGWEGSGQNGRRRGRRL